MGKDCRTFQLRAGPSESLRVLAGRVPSLERGEVGLLFGTHELGRLAPDLIRELAQNNLGTWIFGTGERVWTESGELAGEPALAGLVLPRGSHVLVTSGAPENRPEGLAQGAARKNGEATLVLLGPDEDAFAFTENLSVSSCGEAGVAFGARTSGPLALISGGNAEVRESIVISFPRQTPGRVVSSTACRLISPIVRVTRTDGRALLALDDTPALEMLEQVATSLDEPELFLLALASEGQALSPLGRNIIARSITGIDPDRRALVLEPEIPLGARVALAVQDRGAALTDLERHLGALAAHTRASAPLFGLLLTSERRRRSPLSIEGEVRRITTRFPGLPLIGLTTSLELSPFEGPLSAHVAASVLALFSAVN